MKIKRMRVSRVAGLLAGGVVLGLTTAHAQAACYELYNAKQELVFRSMRPPVDLSLPLHQTLPKVAPGTRMVFSPNSQGCEIEYNKLQPQAVVEIEGEGFRTLSPREPRRRIRG